MNIEEAEKAINKMNKKHHISKWVALVLGAWLFTLPLLPETFPFLKWLKASNPDTLYTMLGFFSFIWAIDNWRTTKELEILKNILHVAKHNT